MNMLSTKILLIAIALIYILVYIIFKSNRLYCFVFNHKDWKLWNKICKHLKEAKLVEQSKDNNGTAIYFRFELVINSINYDIIYWCDDNMVSVHNENECVLSFFDKYHSNKAAKIIKDYWF